MAASSDHPSESATSQGITRSLARYVVATRFDELPAAVRREAQRSLLNWMGVAVSGSRHETIEIALAAIKPFVGAPQATIFGRAERLDIMHAALINGISSHVFDFDDTDLTTAVHPSAPVLPVLLALAEQRGMSGRDFVTAMVLGFEAECRIARAVQPQFGAVGWHPTGAAGVFGAAIATAKVLGLDEARLSHTIGLAATQPVGVREMFGSMTKSFHPGRAAQNGLLAALLAERGYTSSLAGIEAKRGWANVVSSRHNLEVITDGLGQSYEILRNTYKPFACGLVVHPVIDGCIELRNAHNLEVDLIEKIDLDVNPLVLELTAKKMPMTGLEAKFSVYCVAALAIVAGRAGEAEFADAMVRNPVIVELCDRVTATADPRVGKDQARVRIQLKDGRAIEQFVEHAVGSLQKPMSDAALEGKFLDLAEGIMPTTQARRLIELCKVVDTLEDVGEIGRAGAVS